MQIILNIGSANFFVRASLNDIQLYWFHMSSTYYRLRPGECDLMTRRHFLEASINYVLPVHQFDVLAARDQCVW